MVLSLSIVAAIFYGFCYTQLFYAHTCVVWYSTLIQGFVMGVVAGNVETGMVLGGAITLLTISQVASGGMQPSDVAFAGCVAIPIALLGNLDLGTALTLSVAVGLLGDLWTPVFYTLGNIFPHIADKAAEKADIPGIKRAMLLGNITMFVVAAALAFVSVYFGSSFIESAIDNAPEWLLNGLNVAGGVLPAIGIAVTMNVINQPKLTPVFILGYFMVVFFELSVTQMAILGFCVAAILLFAKSQSGQTVATVEDDD